jgi:hypothetical protein
VVCLVRTLISSPPELRRRGTVSVAQAGSEHSKVHDCGRRRTVHVVHSSELPGIASMTVLATLASPALVSLCKGPRMGAHSLVADGDADDADGPNAATCNSDAEDLRA